MIKRLFDNIKLRKERNKYELLYQTIQEKYVELLEQKNNDRADLLKYKTLCLEQKEKISELKKKVKL